jgi:hypothetical protein
LLNLWGIAMGRLMDTIGNLCYLGLVRVGAVIWDNFVICSLSWLLNFSVTKGRVYAPLIDLKRASRRKGCNNTWWQNDLAERGHAGEWPGYPSWISK